MNYPNLLQYSVLSFSVCAVLFGAVLLQPVNGQSEGPLTSQELVRLVYQLPAHPEKRDAIVEEIRRRGINFELTNGIRSVVATKSGDDAVLRHALEEAARRRSNPVVASLPSEAEGREALDKTRAATLAAAGAMPDFIVKQQITRSHALGETQNWNAADHLTVAVSYREQEGERYKLLAVNGLPTGKEEQEKGDYEQAKGASSTGEFVTILRELFAPESQTQFQPVDTDLLRGHRSIIYQYEIKKDLSKQTLKFGDPAVGEQATVVGQRGRVWVDRETYRVLRIEDISTDIPPGFPITAATSTIDYDWITIAGRQYLLPVHAEILMTVRQGARTYQSRNDIRFRNYQKYGTEVRILDDDDVQDESPKKP